MTLDHTKIQPTVLEIVLITVVAALMIGILAWAADIGMQREEARREAATQSQCRFYGHEMNYHARHLHRHVPCQ